MPLGIETDAESFERIIQAITFTEGEISVDLGNPEKLRLGVVFEVWSNVGAGGAIAGDQWGHVDEWLHKAWEFYEAWTMEYHADDEYLKELEEEWGDQWHDILTETWDGQAFEITAEEFVEIYNRHKKRFEKVDVDIQEKEEEEDEGFGFESKTKKVTGSYKKAQKDSQEDFKDTFELPAEEEFKDYLNICAILTGEGTIDKNSTEPIAVAIANDGLGFNPGAAIFADWTNKNEDVAVQAAFEVLEEYKLNNPDKEGKEENQDLWGAQVWTLPSNVVANILSTDEQASKHISIVEKDEV